MVHHRVPHALKEGMKAADGVMPVRLANTPTKPVEQGVKTALAANMHLGTETLDVASVVMITGAITMLLLEVQVVLMLEDTVIQMVMGAVWEVAILSVGYRHGIARGVKNIVEINY